MESTTGDRSVSPETGPASAVQTAVPRPRDPNRALSAAIDLTSGATAASSARRLVATVLRDWHLTDEDWHAEVALIVSELVGNAVRHSASDVRLRVDLDTGLTLTVTDGSAALPHRRAAGPLDESGRGMAIIEAISEAWGSDVTPTGKQVWARLRLPQLRGEPDLRACD